MFQSAWRNVFVDATRVVRRIPLPSGGHANVLLAVEMASMIVFIDNAGVLKAAHSVYRPNDAHAFDMVPDLEAIERLDVKVSVCRDAPSTGGGKGSAGSKSEVPLVPKAPEVLPPKVPGTGFVTRGVPSFRYTPKAPASKDTAGFNAKWFGEMTIFVRIDKDLLDRADVADASDTDGLLQAKDAPVEQDRRARIIQRIEEVKKGREDREKAAAAAAAKAKAKKGGNGCCCCRSRSRGAAATSKEGNDDDDGVVLEKGLVSWNTFVIENSGARMLVSFGLACASIVALGFVIQSSNTPTWTGNILFIYLPVVMSMVGCFTPLPMGLVVSHACGNPTQGCCQCVMSRQFVSKSRAFSYAYMAIVFVGTTLHTCLSVFTRQDITPFFAILATIGHVAMWLAVLTGVAFLVIEHRMDQPEHVLFDENGDLV